MKAESAQPVREDTPSTFKAVEAIPIPYAQMSVRINGGSAGRMVLASVVQGVEKWIAADGLSIWLRDQRIVGTQGFPRDLLASSRIDEQVGTEDAIPSTESAAIASVHYIEWVGKPMGALVRYSRQPDGDTQPVLINGDLRQLQRIVETAKSEIAGEWRNAYWVDVRTATVEFSIQQVPGTDQIVQMQRIYPD
ncbi:MAG: YjbF family lipoprotein [Algiphilus sp.]